MAIRKGTSANDKLIGTNDADQIFGNGGNDSLKGLGGDDLLKGGSGNDTLKGGDGNDTLSGGSGNDKLIGGADGGAFGAEDFLKGGAGQDKFVFAGDVGRDVVQDFQDNTDTLFIDKDFFSNIDEVSGGQVQFGNMSVDDMLTYFASSSGGDSAIDLSGGNGDDAPRIILLGVDNAFDLANDIVFI